MGMISPNMLHERAKKIMLQGKAPVSDEDWVKVVNFWAANISNEEAVCALLAKLYDCPLSSENVEKIAMYQEGRKIYA